MMVNRNGFELWCNITKLYKFELTNVIFQNKSDNFKKKKKNTKKEIYKLTRTVATFYFT